MKPRHMNPLKWPSNSEMHQHMQSMRDKNLSRAVRNANENWMAKKLSNTGLKWKRQAIWGYRIFDFWSHELGVAVEVDGSSHDARYDNYRDEYNYRRSGIMVLRVRNGNEEDACRALEIIANAESWKDRKVRLGIVGNTKKEKRRLVLEPEQETLFGGPET